MQQKIFNIPPTEPLDRQHSAGTTRSRPGSIIPEDQMMEEEELPQPLDDSLSRQQSMLSVTSEVSDAGKSRVSRRSTASKRSYGSRRTRHRRDQSEISTVSTIPTPTPGTSRAAKQFRFEDGTDRGVIQPEVSRAPNPTRSNIQRELSPSHSAPRKVQRNVLPLDPIKSPNDLLSTMKADQHIDDGFASRRRRSLFRTIFLSLSQSLVQ